MVPAGDNATIMLPDELQLESIDSTNGMVTLELFAYFDHVDEQQIAIPEQKQVLVECVYKSPMFPW